MRIRTKVCFKCNERKEVLYRCRYEEKFVERDRINGKWIFVCKICLQDIKKNLFQLISMAVHGKI